MKYNFDRSFKMRINDDPWEIYLLTEEESEEIDQELNGENDGFRALTLTKFDGQCMFFVEGSITKSVITHELFHVYVSYMHLDSSGIDIDSFEEIIAEFLENNIDKVIKIRNKIYNRLIKFEGAI